MLTNATARTSGIRAYLVQIRVEGNWPDWYRSSRRVFTNAIAGRNFDSRSRAHPTATVIVFPRDCLFIGIVHDKGRYRQHLAIDLGDKDPERWETLRCA
jgi:hypothetical protein